MVLNRSLILIAILILTACSPQKRLNRLIDKHPELSRVDTIHDTTTVIVPEVRTDTFLTLDSMLDTVYISKDRLKIKTIWKDNKIYIEGKCETDTIEVIKEIPVEKIVYVEDSWWQKFRKSLGWKEYLVVFGLLLLLILYILRRLKLI